ncbi:MAG: hypothetical protein OZ921_06510 [Sorangiineae bacterium]|nr:hypothetical protein [Polyangiaceae bacterium]MEB2322146.1 hypothetical protein [Sorangiineae bacterium]
MRVVNTRYLTLAAGLLFTWPLVNCGGGDDSRAPGSNSDAGDAGSTDGSNPADGSDGSSCQPKTCADTDQCGTYDDGCGGTLSCQAACKCTPDDFEVTCPTRPCEVTAGCVNHVCQYAPVRCGAAGAEQACAPVDCTGDGCGEIATAAGDESKLYPCGGSVCKDVAFYCDPHPSVKDGKPVYENRCVPPPREGCGACGLGASSCDDATDRFACREVSIPVAEGGGTLECDSTAAASTFIYVDAEYTGGGSDGSRARPYTSYVAALGAAEARNARGIVIAGSPVFTDALVVKNGISVYGGFDASPGFEPNRAQRPRWVIPASAVAGNKLVGGTARDIVDGTVLYHLDVETADATGENGGQGISNFALWVQDSTALRLEEVKVRAGAGSAGKAGVDGRPGDGGTDGNGPEPGLPGSGCTTSCFLSASPPGTQPVQSAPPAANGNKCGAGGRSASNEYNGTAGKAGNANRTTRDLGGGTDPLVFAGGVAGTPAFDNSSCNLSTTPTPGSPGHVGVAGSNGSDASGGARPVLSASGVGSAAIKSGSNGEMGTWGSGGGAGGLYEDGCMNDPNYGGDGGGAGGPGCGGALGTGGGAGGLSVAIALVGSSQNLVVKASTITSSAGGPGGAAGSGGAGGVAGRGAIGGAGVGGGSAVSAAGGKGGDGGPGGRGGHGGGGAGGSSYGVWCEATTMNVTRDSATTVTAGAAGAIGASAGNPGAQGESTPIANCTTP